MANSGSLSFNSLSFSIVDSTISSLAGKGIDWVQNTIGRNFKSGKTKYYYDKDAGGGIWRVIAKKAVGIALSTLSQVAMEQYRKLLDKKEANQRIETIRGKYFNTLIRDTHVKEREKYGRMEVGGGVVFAYDSFGNICTDALMLSIPVKEKVSYSQIVVGGVITENDLYGEEHQYGASGQKAVSFMGDHLVWYDTTALVSMNSDKDLILTKVQGRDYTRKELISNGDLAFSVSGHICSDAPDIYPEEEVKKFYEIMRYKGVVEVNNQFLNLFGITKIVIRNFSLPSNEGGKSHQQYTFEAVGIQPDKEVQVRVDTISIINDTIEEAAKESDEVKWSNLITNRVDALKDASEGALSQGIGLATGYLNSIL